MKIVIDLFSPLSAATQSKESLMRFLRQLGWNVVFNDSQTDAFKTVLGLSEDITQLAALIEAVSDDGMSADEIAQAIGIGQSIFGKITQLSSLDLQALDDLPEPFRSPDEWEQLALSLPNFLITEYLRVYQSNLFEVLLLVGLIRETKQPAPMPVTHEILWEELGGFLTDPVDLIRRTYGWTEGFDFQFLILNLARVLFALGWIPAIRQLRGELAQDWLSFDPDIGALEIEIPLLEATTPDGSGDVSAALVIGPASRPSQAQISGIALTNLTSGNLEQSIDINEDWSLEIQASGELNRALEMKLFPGGIDLETDTGSAAAEILLSGAPETPWLLFGNRNGARLELDRFNMNLGADVSAGVGNFAIGASTISGTDGGLVLTIAPGEGDSFIADILGDQALKINAGIGASWSNSDGFKFEGGVGFDVVIPLNVNLGPIRLTQFRLGLDGGSEGIALEAAVSGGLDLSVLSVVVEDIGLRAKIIPLAEGDQSGLLGPLDLKLEFKPPKGVGLAIDAGGLVSGGGYLYYDEDLFEYGGVAEIGFVSLKLSAIGILATKMPDGSEGWSLFLSVFSEFPPIQLGFGITLSGVGGLVGLHRTFDDEALRDRLLSGALDSIMFPENPVANAQQILADIRAVFPPAQDQFVFGAMLQLGWGSPAILTANLGVIVELPDPIKIALLGQVKIALPTPEAAIIEINMDVFGVANLTEGTLALDATIRDSHILHLLTLSGDMAMRASFTGEPNFLLTIGGFNPKFTPPPGVPNIRRMKASLPLGKLASVDLSCYIALTSNTFQAGGRIDIWVKVSGFTAEGYFGFDALIQFSPFGFDFFVGFGVTVKMGKTTLMGVDVAATVIGPGPWEIDGYAEFKILKFKKKLNLDFEVGRRQSVAVPLYNVARLLRDALQDDENWQVAEPEQTIAILRETNAEASKKVHPAGQISLRQKIVPFNVKIDKFGNGRVDGADRFALDSARLGQKPIAVRSDTQLVEWFAPAEFFNMKAAEKLKSASFEQLDAGLVFSSQDLEFGSAVTLEPDFEEIIIDPALNQRRKRAHVKTQYHAPPKPRSTKPKPRVSVKQPRYVAETTGISSRSRVDILRKSDENHVVTTNYKT